MYSNLAEIWHAYWGGFGANLINIQRVLNDFICKKVEFMSCLQAYSLNLLEEQVENWYIAWFSIREVSIGGKEMNRIGNLRDTKLNCETDYLHKTTSNGNYVSSPF